jgi:GNAT superfamily N-acetyltransferase
MPGKSTDSGIGSDAARAHEQRNLMARADFFRLDRDGDTAVVVADEGRCGRLVIGPRELPYGQTSTFRYAEIYELWVPENWRRRGIGGELVRRALGWAAEHGYERVAVEASARPDRPGLPFYEALGFSPRSVILDSAVPPHDH